MSEASSIRLVRRYSSPRSRVFHAWTTPSEIRKWWNLGNEMKLSKAEVDLRVGGEFLIELQSSDTKSRHSVKGVYREVVPSRKLVYTWIVEDAKLGPNESIVTVEFLDQGDHTEVVLTHEKLRDKDLRQANYVGWTKVMDGLSTMLNDA